MTGFLVYPVERADGRMALRLCRRPTGDRLVDNQPIPLTDGVLDIDPDLETLCRLFEAIARSLLARVR